MHHGSRRRNKIRFTDVVPFFFLCDYVADEGGKVSVRCSSTHEFVEIVVPDGE